MSRCRGRSSRSSVRTLSRTRRSAMVSPSRSPTCSTSRPTSCATRSTRIASTILPRLVVVDTMANMDDVRNNELGSIIRVKQADAVTALAQPPISEQPIKLLEYLDLIGNRRTGVTEQSKGLDPKALQSTAKEGVGLLVTGAQERIELVARTLAETGFRDLFKGLLQEIIENPIPERMIRLRGKWTKVTPDQYDATMDVEVNPAIGRGSDQDRLQMLMGIKQTQEMIIRSHGADNPLVSPIEYRNTLTDLLDFAGMKNTSRYFKEITPQQLQRRCRRPRRSRTPRWSSLRPRPTRCGRGSSRCSPTPGQDHRDGAQGRPRARRARRQDRHRGRPSSAFRVPSLTRTPSRWRSTRPGRRRRSLDRRDPDPDAAYVPLHGPTGALRTR